MKSTVNLGVPNKSAITVSVADAAAVACSSLTAFCEAYPGVALELGETVNLASALLRCLSQYQGDVAVPPAELLHVLLEKLEEGPRKHAFCKELAAEGFPDLIPGLVRPELPKLAEHSICALFEMFESLRYNAIAVKTAEKITTALEQFLESKSAGAGKSAAAAAVGLSKLSGSGPSTLSLAHRRLSDNVIKNLARVLITSQEAAVDPLMVLMSQIAQDSGSFQAHVLLQNQGRDPFQVSRGTGTSNQSDRTGALAHAVSGGFIPGVVRMLRMTRPLASSQAIGILGRNAPYGVEASRTDQRGGATAQEPDPGGVVETNNAIRKVLFAAVSEIIFECKEP